MRSVISCFSKFWIPKILKEISYDQLKILSIPGVSADINGLPSTKVKILSKIYKLFDKDFTKNY